MSLLPKFLHLANSTSIWTVILTAVPVSALTTFLIQELWATKIRNSAKQLQKNYEICDNFFNYIEKCQSLGNAFWSFPRKSIAAETIPDLLFVQSQAENKFHIIEEIGFSGRSRVIDLFENLTGGDFDEENRPARPEISSNIAVICAEICYEIDKFKNSL